MTNALLLLNDAQARGIYSALASMNNVFCPYFCTAVNNVDGTSVVFEFTDFSELVTAGLQEIRIFKCQTSDLMRNGIMDVEELETEFHDTQGRFASAYGV